MCMCLVLLLCSTAEDVLDSSRPQSSLATHLEAGDSVRRPRLPSFFIRQMSESKLLIKSEQIKLLDSVGQGGAQCNVARAYSEAYNHYFR